MMRRTIIWVKMVEMIIDPNTNEVWEYYVDPRLRRYLSDKVMVRINKKDKDYVLLIDGYEGSGKSTFAQQIGRYVDSSLNLDRICLTADEFKQAIIKAQKGQCIIYDEAVTGMTASDSLTKVGRILKSMMMQMRQKNLFVIVILPIIFDFNKYAVLSRARAFFHTYESSGRMGYWVGYNQRDTRQTYLRGKRTHSYRVRSRFKGRFYGKYAIDEKAYRKKKEDTLFKLDAEDETESSRLAKRWKEQANVGLLIIHSILKSYDRVIKEYRKHGVSISSGTISERLRDFHGK